MKPSIKALAIASSAIAAVSCGLAVAATQVPAPAHRPAAHKTSGKNLHNARQTLSRIPSPAVPGQSPKVPALSAAASLQAWRHAAAPSVLWRVEDPANRAVQWAFLPRATAHGDLWFGQKDPGKPWRWIPVRLPGAIPQALPLPVADSLRWAYDLHAGEAGPVQALGSAGSWAALTGTMGEPAGWQAQASTTPQGVYTVSVTIWMASATVPSVYDGLATQWTRANASNGAHAITMILHAPGPLPSIVEPPTSEHRA
jgi:hypothetical protein